MIEKIKNYFIFYILEGWKYFSYFLLIILFNIYSPFILLLLLIPFYSIILFILCAFIVVLSIYNMNYFEKNRYVERDCKFNDKNIVESTRVVIYKGRKRIVKTLPSIRKTLVCKYSGIPSSRINKDTF